MMSPRKKRTIAKIAGITATAAFTFFILSLGIVYAIGANQLQINGYAFFLAQDDDTDILPAMPTSPDGDGSYFVPEISGQIQMQIIDQKYQDGDLYLEVCATNANNGNTTASISFQIANPTAYTWTRGTTSQVSPWTGSDIRNTSFTFQTPTLSPTTLAPGQVATINIGFQAQLGKPETGGSTAITVSYDMPSGSNGTITKSTHVYFIYYPRNTTYGCSL